MPLLGLFPFLRGNRLRIRRERILSLHSVVFEVVVDCGLDWVFWRRLDVVQLQLYLFVVVRQSQRWEPFCEDIFRQVVRDELRLSWEVPAFRGPLGFVLAGLRVFGFGVVVLFFVDVGVREHAVHAAVERYAELETEPRTIFIHLVDKVVLVFGLESLVDHILSEHLVFHSDVRVDVAGHFRAKREIL